MEWYLHRVLASRVHGPLGLLATAVRAVGAGVFLGFGVHKFTNHLPEVASLDRYGLPFPDQFTYAIGVIETGGAALLLLGFVTRLAALALAGDMVGAIATAGRIEGGPIHLGLAPVLLVLMLFLLWSGPGAFAVDTWLLRVMTRRKRPPTASQVSADA